MEEIEMLKGILNSYPYPIVFVDNDYIIRYMNRNAEYHYYEERGYKNLIGKSLFSCHSNEKSIEKIKNWKIWIEFTKMIWKKHLSYSLTKCFFTCYLFFSVILAL